MALHGKGGGQKMRWDECFPLCACAYAYRVCRSVSVCVRVSAVSKAERREPIAGSEGERSD